MFCCYWQQVTYSCRYEEDSFGEGEMPRWDTVLLARLAYTQLQWSINYRSFQESGSPKYGLPHCSQLQFDWHWQCACGKPPDKPGGARRSWVGLGIAEGIGPVRWRSTTKTFRTFCGWCWCLGIHFKASTTKNMWDLSSTLSKVNICISHVDWSLYLL